jgi:salicylate hydroxylase
LLIGADGVWSMVRGTIAPGSASRFAGQVAWRRTITADDVSVRSLIDLGAGRNVTAFLHGGFHLIAYPVRTGAALNLVAFTPGPPMPTAWDGKTDAAPLRQALRSAAPALCNLAEDGSAWTVWPIHSVDQSRPWTSGRVALIGDAAHAMTPFAAQGAAMGIEDAATVAAVAAHANDLSAALADWERQRKVRVAKVARRGAFNQFAWHASGPTALARNLVLRMRAPESLAADMDWLYGWNGADQL